MQISIITYKKIRNYSANYGRCFTSHAVNTCSASPPALHIPCSVYPNAAQFCFAWAPTQYFLILIVQSFSFHPAHISVYGRSQLLNPLFTLVSLQDQGSPFCALQSCLVWKAQGSPSMASPFTGQIVSWTICFFWLTHGEPARPGKAPVSGLITRPKPCMYARQKPSCLWRFCKASAIPGFLATAD